MEAARGVAGPVGRLDRGNGDESGKVVVRTHRGVTVAKSPAGRIRERALDIRAMTAREATFRDVVNELKANDHKYRDEVAEPRRELTDLRREYAKRSELRDGRRWAPVVALSGVTAGAVFSHESGLVVALARK